MKFGGKMAAEQSSIHGLWRNRWLFILAATGSAVGLGNIWKFPYITGENGGALRWSRCGIGKSGSRKLKKHFPRP